MSILLGHIVPQDGSTQDSHTEVKTPQNNRVGYFSPYLLAVSLEIKCVAHFLILTIFPNSGQCDGASDTAKSKHQYRDQI